VHEPQDLSEATGCVDAWFVICGGRNGEVCRMRAIVAVSPRRGDGCQGLSAKLEVQAEAPDVVAETMIDHDAVEVSRRGGIVVTTVLTLTYRYSNFADRLLVNAYSNPPPAARPVRRAAGGRR
jgi:hypothetical protein